MKLNLSIAAGAAVGLVIAGLAGFAGVYLTAFNPKPVARVALPSSPSASPSGGVSGTWTVASGSFVGYRVREQLATLPAPSDAVGRTSAVTGTAACAINADGTATIGALQVKADLTQLASDSSRRDGYVQDNSLGTSRFPTASFVSDTGFSVPAAVVAGAKGTASVSGRMTIHGVTKQLTVPLQIQRNGGSIDIVGSFTFHWGDYGVAAPSVPVASVQSAPPSRSAWC